MAILKSEIRNKYTTVPNSVIRAKDLSDAEYRLLMYLYSLPDGWKINQGYLGSELNCSRININKKLRRIKELGYLEITKSSENKSTDFIYTLKEKKGVSISDVSLNDVSVGDTHINTNIINTEIINTLYNPPKGNEGVDDLFNLFWKSYPRKVSKGNAEKWFKKNKPTRELVDTMIAKLNLLKETEQWKKSNGQFIPYPATWLNAKGWEDEVKVDNATGTNILNGHKLGDIIEKNGHTYLVTKDGEVLYDK